jgi:hypothetical protein
MLTFGHLVEVSTSKIASPMSESVEYGHYIAISKAPCLAQKYTDFYYNMPAFSTLLSF